MVVLLTMSYFSVFTTRYFEIHVHCWDTLLFKLDFIVYSSDPVNKWRLLCHFLFGKSTIIPFFTCPLTSLLITLWPHSHPFRQVKTKFYSLSFKLVSEVFVEKKIIKTMVSIPARWGFSTIFILFLVLLNSICYFLLTPGGMLSSTCCFLLTSGMQTQMPIALGCSINKWVKQSSYKKNRHPYT